MIFQRWPYRVSSSPRPTSWSTTVSCVRPFGYVRQSSIGIRAPIGTMLLERECEPSANRDNHRVPARSGYRDEMWRLATAGDVASLVRAALLVDGYDASRARAFALAIEGRLADALTELRAGSAEDWPFPAASAADVARVRYLAGDDRGALASLAETARAAERLDPAVAELATAVARRTPGLRWTAVRVVLSAGTVRERLRNAAATLRG